MKHIVIATSDVPHMLVRNGLGEIIQKGEKRTATKNFFRNGEGWYHFTDGTEAPDVFFEKA